MNKIKSVVLFAAGIFSGIFVIILTAFSENDKVQDSQYEWHAPDIPAQMMFAGEPVPLHQWDVRERFDRELLYNYYYQNNVLYMLKLANRHFPIIEERLKANGIPEDFKYLCVAESNLLANAISRSGAKGYWQFLSGTAPGYNLEVNKYVDQRFDIIKSTDAASKYLKAAYNKFQSWTAAAASYNCGQGGYNSQSTIQKTNNYYDLVLPEETNRYIFRILAFKHLMENAIELGFILEDKELYQPLKTRTLVITQTIPDLVQFANNNGTNYKNLKLMNPWLRSRSLPVKQGKSYSILIPITTNQ